MMKKLLIIYGIGILTLSLASCKKDYRCTCNETIDGVYTNNNGKTVGYSESSEEDADWYCKNLETSHTVDGTSVGYECTLEEL